MINSALSRAFTAREKVAQAQQSAMDALNLPSASELEKLGRRLRTISQRLEEVEDAVDKIGVRLETPVRGGAVGREALRPARPDRGAARAARPRRRRPAPRHRPRGRARRATRDRPGGVDALREARARASRAAVPDAVRRAVERTVQSTLGSAEVTARTGTGPRATTWCAWPSTSAARGRARCARGRAAAGAVAGVDRVRDALQDLRTATERLAERVAQLETQLEEQLGVTPKRGSTKSAARSRSAPTKAAASGSRREAQAARPRQPKRATATAKRCAAAKPKRATVDSQARDRIEAEARGGQAASRPSAKGSSAAGRRTSGSSADPAPRARADGPPGPHHRRLRFLGDRACTSPRALAARSSTSPGSTCARRPPTSQRTEFIRADIRNPLISKLLPQTEVDTVVHCDVLLVPEPGKAPEQLHDINVIGSLQLLAACEKTETVRTIVVRGSAAIYGAEPNAPEFFTEDMARRFPFRTRFQRDVGELESYFENFSRRYPARDGDDAALPADARHRDRLAAHALPAASRWSRPSSASTRCCSSCTPRTRSARSRRRSCGRCAGR